MLVRWTGCSKNSVSVGSCSGMDNWQQNGSVVHAGHKASQAIPERVGKRVSWVLPQTTWRRPSQSGWPGLLLVLVVLSRALRSFPPSWLANLQKLLSITLLPTLGFHDAQGQSIVTTFSVGKKWTDACFPVKQQLMCHLSQECIHFINFSSRGQGFN